MDRRSVQIEFDLDKLQQVSILGVKRAAAFIAIAFNSTEGWIGPSLSLSGHSMWRFFPDPPPSEIVNSAVTEFRSWVVDNALRELDAAFNEFVDRAWVGLELCKLHGMAIKSDFKIDGIENKTNAASKLEKLLVALNSDLAKVKKLRSLSNARNCLTHARGVVTTRHANVDGALQIEWLGLEMAFEQGDVYSVIPVPIPEEGVRAPNPLERANVVAKVVDRKKVFALGSVVKIEPLELHEICQFYLVLTDQVIDALKLEFAKKGIPHREKRPSGVAET